MKNLLIFTMMLFAFVANSSNYFTFGTNDSLRIPPRYSGGYYQTDVRAHIDGKMDNFDIIISYPQGLMPRPWHGIEGGEDMTIAYLDYTGAEQTYTAPLTISNDYGEVSAFIPVSGWWDYNMDGVWESYGTAKWDAGDYAQMFTFRFFLDDSFRSGWVTLDGHLDSGHDSRGAILADVTFFKRVWVYVGYIRGDLNGDDRLTIADVTLLINYLLMDGDGYDIWQSIAADFDDNGTANITDVSRLINYLLTDKP